MEDTLQSDNTSDAEIDALEPYSELQWLARELCMYFPQLDLRFTIQEGAPALRCSLPVDEESEDSILDEDEDSREFKTVEFNADTLRAEDLLLDAILSIKELAQLYDD